MTRKTAIFEGCSWFSISNYGLALDMDLKIYTSVAGGLKPKVKKFWGVDPTFVEITGEKLVGGLFGPHSSWIGLRISSINVTKSTVFCGFAHVYQRHS